jgi:hypothetical protein
MLVNTGQHSQKQNKHVLVVAQSTVQPVFVTRHLLPTTMAQTFMIEDVPEGRLIALTLKNIVMT